MRYIVFLVFWSVLCGREGAVSQCKHTFNAPNARALESKVVTSLVECLASKVHSGEFEAWQISVYRVASKGEEEYLRLTEITWVGADPKTLTVRYKTTKAGSLYLSIAELEMFLEIGLDGEVSSRKEEEFNIVDEESRPLTVVPAHPIEVNGEDFPPL